MGKQNLDFFFLVPRKRKFSTQKLVFWEKNFPTA